MSTIQETKDTVALLKECDAGSKMAVKSIRQVLDDTSSEELNALLSQSVQDHEALGNKLHEMLNELGEQAEEPPMMGKVGSWMMTGFKMMVDNSDHQIASLIIDGCNMGIKSLVEYRNQYKDASGKAVELCEKLIGIEEELSDKLRKFL